MVWCGSVHGYFCLKIIPSLSRAVARGGFQGFRNSPFGLLLLNFKRKNDRNPLSGIPRGVISTFEEKEKNINSKRCHMLYPGLQYYKDALIGRSYKPPMYTKLMQWGIQCSTVFAKCVMYSRTINLSIFNSITISSESELRKLRLALRLLEICAHNQGNAISEDQKCNNFPWEHGLYTVQ